MTENVAECENAVQDEPENITCAEKDMGESMEVDGKVTEDCQVRETVEDDSTKIAEAENVGETDDENVEKSEEQMEESQTEGKFFIGNDFSKSICYVSVLKKEVCV